MLPHSAKLEDRRRLQFERLASIGTFLGAAILMWFVLYLIGCYIELLAMLGRTW